MAATQMTWAQEGQEGAEGRRGRERGNRQRRGGDMHMMGGAMFMRQYDKDENLIVDEQEFESAITEFRAQVTNAYALIVGGFDQDKDGTLNEEEITKIEESMRVMMMIRRSDTNSDLKLDEEELTAMKERQAEMLQRYNEMMIRRCDKNEDGEIDEEEATQAREEMEQRMAKWRQRHERGRKGEGKKQREKAGE